MSALVHEQPHEDHEPNQRLLEICRTLPQYCLIMNCELRQANESLYSTQVPYFPGFGVTTWAVGEALRATQIAIAEHCAPWFEEQRA